MLESRTGTRKLVVVTERSLDGRGGQQASTLTMLRSPAEWTLITPSLPRSADISGVEAIQAQTLSIPLPGITNSLVSRREAHRLDQQLREKDPDAIIFEDGGSFGRSLHRRLPTELQGISYAMWRHIMNEPLGDLNLPPRRRAITAVYQRIAGNFARTVGTNLAVSQAVATSLSEIGVPEDRIAVIPEQIGDEFNPKIRLEDRGKPYKETTRSKFLKQDEFGVLSAGRIMDLKRIDWVAKMYEQLCTESRYLAPHDGVFKRLKITIIGPVEPSYKEKFEGIMQKLKQIGMETGNETSGPVSIEYVGPKSPEELQEYYNAYNVLYMPSQTEGFGRTTAEAMKGGMTVIGRNQTAATREILSAAPYPIGILINSPEEATREVISLMQHPERLDTLQGNALTWSNGYYTEEKARNGLWNAIDRSGR